MESKTMIRISLESVMVESLNNGHDGMILCNEKVLISYEAMSSTSHHMAITTFMMIRLER
jgi:hypothetical protein